MTFVEAPVVSGDVRAHIAADPLPTASTSAAGRVTGAHHVLGSLGQEQDDHERS
jgi:hypothetical protein